MDERETSGSGAERRRLAIAVVTVTVLSIVGRIAMFLWSQWLAIPFLVVMVAVVAVLAVMEARAQRKKVPELLAEAFRRMRKRRE